MDIYDELVRLRRLGQKCAVATIVQVNGSIPSYESAKLLVREDGSMIGTIGGGCVEAEVWNAAREVIQNEKPKHLTFSLGQDAAYDNGLICGGQLNVFVEPVTPQPRALIFGAGHISKSLSKFADMAGFATSVIDNREAFANRERFPEAEEVHAAEYEDVFPEFTVNGSSYIVIVTRGHRDDMRVLRWAVTTQARYIAMIGSRRKVIGVVRELEKEGISSQEYERVFAPMGFEIGAVTPEEIAISVVAEMIAVRRDPRSEWRALFEVDLRYGIGASDSKMIVPAIAGLILSAGASSRMGTPKALLPIHGESFLDRLIDVFSRHCAPVVVVLGYEADRIRAGLERSRHAVFAINLDPARGMLSSLQCGLAALPPHLDAVLFTPVDYPNIQAATIGKLAADFCAHRAPVTVPVHAGQRGHPVCIARPIFAELLALPVTQQARDVIHAHRDRTRQVSVDDPGILTDIDNPEDYRVLQEQLAR